MQQESVNCWLTDILIKFNKTSTDTDLMSAVWTLDSQQRTEDWAELQRYCSGRLVENDLTNGEGRL